MNFQERKQIILATIEEKNSISVKDLSELTRTSEITIRRDLIVLAESGLVFRTHGGAMKIELAKDKISFANKSAVHIQEKQYICQKAAKLIQENDVIFMDCGSTIFHLCQYIKNMNIKVITNSLPVIYELINSTVTVNLIGGEVDKKRMAVHGYMAEEHIRKYKANKAFIGVDGISKDGLSANTEYEAGIALAMAKCADEVILLCDSSKIDKEKYLKFAPIEIINTLITDKNAEAGILKSYAEKGIKIIQ